MRIFWIVFLLLTFIGPVWKVASGQIVLYRDWKTMSHDSAHIAPSPKTNPEAVVQIYAATTFNWRGLFAVHTWFATKEKNAKQYVTYQVIGWRLLTGLPVLSVEDNIPDRKWFGQEPKVLYDIRGEKAEKIIPQITKAAAAYPYPQHYDLWPGPNSNTFSAYILRAIPDIGIALPSNAVGKDYLPAFTFFARAPSGTGYQFSLLGIFGIMVAREEGFEINILGLVYGVSFSPFTLKLPGFGDIVM